MATQRLAAAAAGALPGAVCGNERSGDSEAVYGVCGGDLPGGVDGGDGGEDRAAGEGEGGGVGRTGPETVWESVLLLAGSRAGDGAVDRGVCEEVWGLCVLECLFASWHQWKDKMVGTILHSNFPFQPTLFDTFSL